MKIEQVSKARIQAELIKLEKNAIKGMFITLFVFFIVLFWLPMFIFRAVGVLVYLCILLLIGALYSIGRAKRIKKVKSNRFHIFSDKLMGYGENDVFDVDDALSKRDKRYELHFAGVDPYVMYVNRLGTRKRMYYEWSDTYSMTPEGVYNSSLVGDEFYIVSVDNRKADLFFNKKFFKIDL